MTKSGIFQINLRYGVVGVSSSHWGGLGAHPQELFENYPLFPAILGHSVVALIKFLKAIFFMVCVGKSAVSEIKLSDCAPAGCTFSRNGAPS